MDKNVRIAIQLQHKDDSISENVGSLAFGDFEWDKRRFLRYANGNNEWLLFKDTNTDEINDLINGILEPGGTNPKLDPSIIFTYQFDDNNDPTYSEDVLNKWKTWFVENYNNSKPYIWHVYDNGLHVEMIPILHEKCITTSVRFDGDTHDYSSIGRAVEGLINKFINIENNLTFRLVHIYDRCMEIAHNLHLLDVNQDAKLLDIWSRLININGTYDEIEKWLPNVDMYRKPALPYTIDISTSDSGYLYKYVLENTDTNDKTPVYNTSISCEAIKPATFAELLHTKDGILMNSMISKSELTDYIRRDLVDYDKWEITSSSEFTSNPLVPTTSYSISLGDNDNQVNSVKGKINLSYKLDVPVFAFEQMPWVQVTAECYNFNGTKMKDVSCIWDSTGTTKLDITAENLSKEHSFSASLNGYFAVKLRMTVFWGTFNAWSDEVEIAYFGIQRGDNSGGTWDFNTYIFNNQSNRICTRFKTEAVEKYIKSIYIDGKEYWNLGWHELDPDLTWKPGRTLSMHYKINYHYTRWYGYIIAKDGCNAKCARWHNLSKTEEIDRSSSMHYYGTAQNYGLLTKVDLTATCSGKKAVYTPDTYNTPAIFNPVTKDCTIMLKGGEIYKVYSHCGNLRCRQVGIYKVDVGTINAQLLNTVYYGNDLINRNDFLIRGNNRAYKLDIYGKEPKNIKIASGVPDKNMNYSISRSTVSDSTINGIPSKPDQENSPGYITKVNLGRKYRLDENPRHDVIITLKDNSIIKFTIPFFTYSDKWDQIWLSEDRGYQRCYMFIQDNIAYFMTYYIDVQKIEINMVNGNTLELLVRDSQTNEVVMNFSLMEEKPRNYIPVTYNKNQYYIELCETNQYGNENLVVEDCATGKIKGYLK